MRVPRLCHSQRVKAQTDTLNSDSHIPRVDAELAGSLRPDSSFLTMPIMHTAATQSGTLG